MEGYTPASRVYNVSYEDFPGLLIKCKSASIGELRLAGSGVDTGTQLGFFATKIISWNMQHPAVDGFTETKNDDGSITFTAITECPVCGLKEGDEIAPTAQAMQCLELDFCLALMLGWIAALTKVSPPKELSSTNGGRNSQEELMRQLAAMQNPGTLPTPNFD